MAVHSDKAVTLPWPELRLLAVPPDQRGQGIGAALVRECIEGARRSGVKILALHTTDMMRTAMRMYERLDFARPRTGCNPVLASSRAPFTDRPIF